MAGSISAGGLATGLDTARVIEQLLALERRPLALLTQRAAALEASRAAVAAFVSKLAALQAAARSLRTADGVLAPSAESSDPRFVAARAGAGAVPGATSITVVTLARPSTAVSSVGLGAAGAPVAAGPGSFVLQVGGGPLETVTVDASTTLADLAQAIDRLDAGVSARVVDLGGAGGPDLRLQITSRATGDAHAITIVEDDTTLGLTTVDHGEDARFIVSGVVGTFTRASNVVDDVIDGVTVELLGLGTGRVTVRNDAEVGAGRVHALVDAFNALVGFVGNESDEGTIRRLVDRLHGAVSTPLAGASGRWVNLSSVGIATRRDGTLALDESRLRAALAADPSAVAQLFAGNGIGVGAANALDQLVAEATGKGGSLALRGTALDQHLQDLQERIDAGQRAVDVFERDLRRRFAALEELVASLQDQAAFLRAALGTGE